MRLAAIPPCLLAAGFALAALPDAASAQNSAPIFMPLDPQQVDIGQDLELLVMASDPEGDALSLAVSGAPENAFFMDRGDGTAVFLWTPDATQAGNHTVTFHATDAGTPMASATLELAITVGDVTNHPPVLTPPDDLVLDPGVEVTISFRASDPDGDALTIQARPLPPGAADSPFGFTWMPGADQVGSYPLTVTATDTGSPPMSDSAPMVVTVGAVNRPPMLEPIGDRVASVGDVVRIALVASDADGDALALSCTGLPSDATFADLLNGTGEIVWNPSAAGTWAATCQAQDTGNPPGIAEETFQLTAVGAEDAPALSEARWDATRERLFVRGQLPPLYGPRAPARVEVFARLADGTDVLLGSRRADRNFLFGLSPFIAPCQVVIATDGVPGGPLAVTNAPARCEELLLRVDQARASCRGELHVKGHRAPPEGSVLGDDAATGDSLFAVTPERSGFFRARAALRHVPADVSLRVEAAQHTWTLDEAVPVRTKRCGGRR